MAALRPISAGQLSCPPLGSSGRLSSPGPNRAASSLPDGRARRFEGELRRGDSGSSRLNADSRVSRATFDLDLVHHTRGTSDTSPLERVRLNAPLASAERRCCRGRRRPVRGNASICISGTPCRRHGQWNMAEPPAIVNGFFLDSPLFVQNFVTNHAIGRTSVRRGAIREFRVNDEFSSPRVAQWTSVRDAASDHRVREEVASR